MATGACGEPGWQRSSPAGNGTGMNAGRPSGSGLVVALDMADESCALALAARLDARLCRLKVGKELFTAAGPSLLERLRERGFEVFLDLKFHDIPNTVAGAVRAAAGHDVWMLDVHALGGRSMMCAAREALAGVSGVRPLLVAVTVLTSMDERDLGEVGLSGSPLDNVRRLAVLTRECGLDGVVCSAREIAALRRECGTDFLLVTPGIRPTSSVAGDQKRTLTPGEAVRLGASHLVIGRPVTAAVDPSLAVERIVAEMDAAGSQDTAG